MASSCSWAAVYSESCLEYLVGRKKVAILIFRWLYLVAVFIGPYMTVSAVWNIADIFNGLMAVPNLIGVVALSGVVVKDTKDYFRRLKRVKEMGGDEDDLSAYDESPGEAEGESGDIFPSSDSPENTGMPHFSEAEAENAAGACAAGET